MTHTKEALFDHIKVTLIDLFELDETVIVPEAKLYEDLDIDSIDAVDLLIELKKTVGVNILPEHFKEARTLQNIVDIAAELQC